MKLGPLEIARHKHYAVCFFPRLGISPLSPTFDRTDHGVRLSRWGPISNQSSRPEISPLSQMFERPPNAIKRSKPNR